MRIKFNKEIEFFFKKFFLSQSYLLKKRLERSIKNNDEEELKLVKSFISPGTDSIDIGVYRGVYSFEMSKYSKMVHAFEPNPILFDNIEKNLKKIIKNINFYNYALSNKNELVSLKVPIRNKNYNKNNYEEYFEMGRASIHIKNEINEFESFEIKSNLLDNFNFSNKISFIKIDVEGHETEVIKGSEATIKKNKPILLVEIEEKYTLKKVIDTLNYINSLGYNSFYFKDNKLTSTNSLNDLNLFNNFIFKPL
jgi:FkbM family methyltransferase